MKNLFLISGVFAMLLLLSCGQSENDKQMEQKLRALTRYQDSIKQDAASKKAAAKLKREQQQIARSLLADKEKLVKENIDLFNAKQGLANILMPHLFRSQAKKDAEIENQTLIINTIQDSISAISNRMNGNCIIWTPYNSYVSVYIDGNYIGSTQGAGIQNGVNTTVNSRISHTVIGKSTSNGENWKDTIDAFATDQTMHFELQ